MTDTSNEYSIVEIKETLLSVRWNSPNVSHLVALDITVLAKNCLPSESRTPTFNMNNKQNKIEVAKHF